MTMTIRFEAIPPVGTANVGGNGLHDCTDDLPRIIQYPT